MSDRCKICECRLLKKDYEQGICVADKKNADSYAICIECSSCLRRAIAERHEQMKHIVHGERLGKE